MKSIRCMRTLSRGTRALGPRVQHSSQSPRSDSLARFRSQRQHPPKTLYELHDASENPNGDLGRSSSTTNRSSFTGYPLLDTLLTTAVGLTAVLVGGAAYLEWYKKRVIDKIEDAFQPGYSPTFELGKVYTAKRAIRDADGLDPIFEEDEPWTFSLRRKEQDVLDQIIHGQQPGHYFMLLGPKGSGKGAMVLDAIAECQADGVAMCYAHPDLEVFRSRLGKALNFEFNEDSQASLFQRREPREGTPALDIERALNKLEAVAVQHAKERGRPLVLIINNIHFFPNDDAGRNILLQLQQEAESWAARGILTMVFSSDDFWPFHVLRKSGSRMHVLSIYDLDVRESVHALARMRVGVLGKSPPSASILEEAISLVGGRLSHLNKVSKSRDMIAMAKHLLEVEKGWLLSQIGLIPDFSDDVVDEQKWSSSSWLLLQEFVELRKQQLEVMAETGEELKEHGLPLPAIPYWRCCQIMTRPDFMEELDRLNIIAIDIQHNVRPDSNLILNAAQQVTDEDGFNELLDNVRNRINEIESLRRTRELTFKDLSKGDVVRLAVDKRGAELLDTLNGDDD